LVLATVVSISLPFMARPGVVGVCDTAAAAERSATPTRVAAVEFDFMTFISCFAAETTTAGGAGKGAI
jgi:hypothetical protein